MVTCLEIGVILAFLFLAATQHDVLRGELHIVTRIFIQDFRRDREACGSSDGAVMVKDNTAPYNPQSWCSDGTGGPIRRKINRTESTLSQ